MSEERCYICSDTTENLYCSECREPICLGHAIFESTAICAECVARKREYERKSSGSEHLDRYIKKNRISYIVIGVVTAFIVVWQAGLLDPAHKAKEVAIDYADRIGFVKSELEVIRVNGSGPWEITLEGARQDGTAQIRMELGQDPWDAVGNSMYRDSITVRVYRREDGTHHVVPQ